MSRVAVVTGGSRGIGEAISVMLKQNGYRVAATYAGNDDAAHAFKEEHGIDVYKFDVGDYEACEKAVAQISEDLGPVEVSVNNAGITHRNQPMLDVDEATFDRVYAVNVKSVYLTAIHAVPILRERKGAIVNIASISGLRASTLRVAYGTSKAGVMHLTQQQAAEWGEWGVRANCICPGPVATKLAMAVHTQDIIDAYHDAIPLNRYGSEEEIGNVIVFLCSDKASYVTGQVIAVDGGFESTGIGLPSLRG